MPDLVPDLNELSLALDTVCKQLLEAASEEGESAADRDEFKILAAELRSAGQTFVTEYERELASLGQQEAEAEQMLAEVERVRADEAQLEAALPPRDEALGHEVHDHGEKAPAIVPVAPLAAASQEESIARAWIDPEESEQGGMEPSPPAIAPPSSPPRRPGDEEIWEDLSHVKDED